MAETERVYTIPLREVKTAPRWKRSKRAVYEVKKYLAKHMKTSIEDVKIGTALNEAIWARGAEKPTATGRGEGAKVRPGGVSAWFCGGRKKIPGKG
jgi:large subunit ribosomal protein L31e